MVEQTYQIRLDETTINKIVSQIILSTPIGKLFGDVWESYLYLDTISPRIKPEGYPYSTGFKKSVDDAVRVLPEIATYSRNIEGEVQRVKIFGLTSDLFNQNGYFDINHPNYHFFVGSDEEKRRIANTDHTSQQQFCVIDDNLGRSSTELYLELSCQIKKSGFFGRSAMFIRPTIYALITHNFAPPYAEEDKCNDDITKIGLQYFLNENLAYIKNQCNWLTSEEKESKIKNDINQHSWCILLKNWNNKLQQKVEEHLQILGLKKD